MTASTENNASADYVVIIFRQRMSEEHYPARNTGNEDIVAVDLGKMFDTFISENVHAEIRQSWTMVKHLKASLETYLIHS